MPARQGSSESAPKYTSLRELTPGVSTNIYGVISEISPSAVSEKGTHSLKATIRLRECPPASSEDTHAHVTLVLFGDSLQDFPPFEIGNILRGHRMIIQSWNSTPQIVGKCFQIL